MIVLGQLKLVQVKNHLKFLISSVTYYFKNQNKSLHPSLPEKLYSFLLLTVADDKDIYNFSSL